MKLKEISVSGFRAFNTEYTFQFDDKLTVFVGMNGTGKTSLCDAIQFGILGKLPQYKDVKEAAFQDMIINRNNPDRRVKVLLKFSNGAFIRREKKSKGILKPTQEVKISESQGVPAISYEDFRSTIYLRQEQIRRFIEADKKTKIQELSSLLGVEAIIGITEGIREFNERLKKVVKTTQQRLDELQRREKSVKEQHIIVSKLEKGIKEKWQLSEEELSNKLTVANIVSTARGIWRDFDEICSKLNLSPLSEVKEDITSVGVFIHEFENRKSTVYKAIEDGIKAVERYNTIKEELEKLDEESIKRENADAEKEIEKKRNEIDIKSEYAKLIASAKDYLSKRKPSNCPICERPIDADKILRHLEEASTKESREIEELKKEIKKLEKIIKENNKKLDHIQTLKNELSNIVSKYAVDENYFKLKEKFEKISDEFEQLKDLFNLRQEKRKADGLQDLVPSAEEIQRVEKELKHLTSLSKVIDVLNDELQNRYTDFINQRLEELDSYVEEYIRILAPHPRFSKVYIRYEGDSYWLKGVSEDGEEVYVRTLFSTAQLNETAIILLLAMASSARHRYEFILLDDPSQSLDKAGKKKLAELLVKVAELKQLVVCTMDTEFGEFLQSLAPDGKFYLFEGYSDKGPRVREWHP